MTTPFGMPTFVKVGKKKTPKQLGAPGTVRPPTEPGAITIGDLCATDSTTNETTGHAFPVPSDAKVGDLCLTFISTEDSAITNVPSGWTEQYSVTTSGGTYDYAYLYTKVLESADLSGALTFDLNGAGDSAALSVIFRSSGTLLESMLTLSGPVGMDTAAHDPPTVTPSQGAGDYYVVVVFHENKGDFTTSFEDDGPTGYTAKCEVKESAEVLAPALHLWYATKSITTSENPSEIGWSDSLGNRDYATVTLAIPTDTGTSDVAAGDHTHLAIDEAAVTVENAGTVVGTRPRLNFIEGTDISLTLVDDSANDEIDITIASTGGGGGSGENNSIYQHADYPASADAFDEEFDTDPTAGWTWVNQSTASVSVGQSVLTISDNRNVNNVSFIGVAPPSAQDYTIETFVYPWHGDEDANRHMGGLAVRWGTTINGVGFYLGTQMRTITWGSSGTGTATGQSTSYTMHMAGPHFLRVVWDNTAGTLAFEYSPAGNEWFQIHSFTPVSTPDLVGLFGEFERNHEIKYSFEYLRRTA